MKTLIILAVSALAAVCGASETNKLDAVTVVARLQIKLSEQQTNLALINELIRTNTSGTNSGYAHGLNKEKRKMLSKIASTEDAIKEWQKK